VAKRKGGAEDDTAKGSKKKLIIPVVLLVAGLFAGKTFFASKPEKSEAELEADAAAAEAALYEECATANGVPVDGEAGDADSGSDGEPGAEGEMHESSARSSATLGDVVLVAATRPAQEGAVLPSVLEMESVTVNLADDHYLKLGLALQLREGTTAEAADKEGLGARALDMALERVAAKRMQDLVPASARVELKRQLGLDVCLAYKGVVTTVYFTEFVMQ
jgi:flagellar FliL protein